MASSFGVLVFLCLAATVSVVHGIFYFGFNPPCAEPLCEDVARNDPEKNLRAAVSRGDPDLCECFCPESASLFHQSIPSNCVVCVDLLANESLACNLNYKRVTYGWTPLQTAMAVCNKVMTNAFLQAGVDANYFVGPSTNAPICFAAVRDDPNCGDIIRDLVNAGADICQDCDGELPIDIAVHPNVRNIIEQEGGAECP